ncbi:TetR/AcrR family transcriptional regulator [Chloroflexi bacterium TSY]|nr:TetR/AcrR family transcriptional regulator [Chloroflexi bacterium TSY]
MSTIKEQFRIARRNEILDAATDLFAELGYNKTSIRKVAQRAGIADGTIYYYFKNKNDLLIGIIDRLNQTGLDELDVKQEIYNTNLEDYLPAYLAQYMAAIYRNRAALRAIIPQLLIDKALREQLRKQILAPNNKFAHGYFTYLVEVGQIRSVDPMFASYAITYLLFGGLIPHIFDDELHEEDWEAQAQQLVDIIMNGLNFTFW